MKWNSRPKLISLSSATVERAFSTSYALHPEKTEMIARQILPEAYDWALALRRTQDRRNINEKSYKLELLDECLVQEGVFRASEDWERDQESAVPVKRPNYNPSRGDLLVRYLKLLTYLSMDRRPRYAAIALGCFLYNYDPVQIHTLAPDYFDNDNIRRVKGWFSRKIKHRFPEIDGAELPGDNDRAVVWESLSKFALWERHIDQCGSIRQEYFGLPQSEHSDCIRVHVLADPTCGGFARLIKDFNSETENPMQDPETNMQVPTFKHDQISDNQHSNSDTDERFQRKLTHGEIVAIRDELLSYARHNRDRRRNYHSGMLSIFVDGELVESFRPGARGSISLWVPADASHLEVRGRQMEGCDLLLAVIPLPDTAEGFSEPREFHVPLEGRKAIDLIIRPAQLCEDAKLHVELTYSEPDRAMLSHTLMKLNGTVADLIAKRGGVAWGVAGLALVGFLVVSTMLVRARLENQDLRESLQRGRHADHLLVERFGVVQSRTSSRLDEVRKRMQELKQQSTFNTSMDLGSAFMYAGRFDEALDFYEQAKQIKPDNEEPYKAEAAIYKLRGDYDKSIEVLQTLLHYQPANAGAWNYLGWNYYSIGEHDKARQAYEHALRVKSSYADALFNLALVERAQGFTERYERLLEKARGILTGEVQKNPHYATAYFQLAKTYAYEKKWAEAIRYLNKAITGDSEWAFWLRHELFFKDLPESYGREQQVIATLGDAYIEIKINRILDNLS